MLGKNKLREFIKRILGDNILGILDYYRFPVMRQGCGGIFNGQEGRIRIFEEIITKFSPAYIVETGTYRGTTTKYFTSFSKLPVYTIEANARFLSYAKYNFRKFNNVKAYCGDSREVLLTLFRKKALVGSGFFYLDSHWQEDLPLGAELSIIFDKQEKSVVMIDDFQVPGDAGYKYDDYGRGKVLSIEYIQPLVDRFSLEVYFPSLPSYRETGTKRGCVVLAKKGVLNRSGDQLKSLRKLSAEG